MKLHLQNGVLLLSLCLVGCGGGGGGGGSSTSNSSAYLNVVLTTPEQGDSNISTEQSLSVTFDHPVDESSLSGNFVVESSDGTLVPGNFSLSESGRQITFNPSSPLDAGKTYRLHVTPGVRDTNGTPLFVNYLSAFDTTPSFQAYLYPYNGAYLVPSNASVAVWFNKVINPSTVNGTTVYLQGPSGLVSGTIEFLQGNRAIAFHPDNSLATSTNYTLHVSGGANGVLTLEGESLASSAESVFQTGLSADYTTPAISVTIHEIPAGMNSNLTIPSSGSEIDINFSDGFSGYLNPGTMTLTANVAVGSNVAGTNLLQVLPIVSIQPTLMRLRIPKSLELSANSVTFYATARDLQGNLGSASPFTCKVQAETNELLPFEYVQVCWVRFDLDRDSESGEDFEKDLFVYGLIADGDPIGKNAYLRDLIEQKIIDTANGLFKTPTFGRVLFTRSEPNSVIYMKMAIGGFDPTSSSMDVNDPTTGVLGRAVFDALNSNFKDDDTVLSPPVGVFPREMFRAYNLNSGITDILFSSTFIGISPDLGGTAIGAHNLDSIVLDPSFNYSTASVAEKNRYNTVFNAINRFGKSIGFLLAHETGHAVGLVPNNLNGTNFHDAQGAANDVMLAAVSFTSIVLLDPRFRPLDLAYLLHWVLSV